MYRNKKGLRLFFIAFYIKTCYTNPERVKLMKEKLKLPLKLTGDRLLFIVITWVFSITLSVFLQFITSGANIGIYYSIITAIPYTALIYYEVYDAGSHESGQNIASLKSAAVRLIIWQIPSLIFFILYIISLSGVMDSSFIGWLFGGIYLAPYIGPRGISESVTSNIIQFLVFMLLESSVFISSYYLGMKDIVLIKTKKKKSSGFMKK